MAATGGDGGVNIGWIGEEGKLPGDSQCDHFVTEKHSADTQTSLQFGTIFALSEARP